ncbi:hypothetical protein DUI87_14899 [Hirundo rustica rustica]|uniref:Uncharacterized protein n=1 Tax=Hirundo rustica rustica TaxID=333673 RepID=A0A3M0K7T8_HIRRU|nr:hypothetical protein DUI87_14899 [Hirundo rustica rustica]
MVAGDAQDHRDKAAAELVELLPEEQSSSYLTIQVKFIARHYCPDGPPVREPGQKAKQRLITNGQNVPLPPYPNHQTPSIKNIFLKKILVDGLDMEHGLPW